MEFSRQYLVALATKTNFIRDTLEKVLRLSEILKFLNSDIVFKGKLALKGGTAINLTAVELPRLSVDIDLDFTENIPRDELLLVKERFSKRLTDYMWQEGYSVADTRDSFALTSFLFNYVNTEAIHALEKEKRQIIALYEQGYTQSEIATQLGVTQSYISKQLKTALGEIDDAELDGDLTDIEYKVNKFWDMFIAKHKMPHGFDVIMDMFLAMLPGEEFDRLLKWMYGYREFLRTTLKYLLLYDGKEIDDNAENKLWKGLPPRQKAIYAAVFLDAPDSCKMTYLRLATEVERRRKTFKEEPKGSAFVELHKQVERIAKLRGVTAEEYLQKQFIPEFLKQKEKRYAQYRKEVKQEYPNILVVDENDSRSIQEQLIEMFGDGEKPKIKKKK